MVCMRCAVEYTLSMKIFNYQNKSVGTTQLRKHPGGKKHIILLGKVP